MPVAQLPLLRNRAWTPPLSLTAEEAGVVAQEGSVLLLGRSGTGKTLCLVHRMSRDRTISSAGGGTSGVGGGTTLPRQLFVCCSKQLCAYVRALYNQQQPALTGDEEASQFQPKFARSVNYNTITPLRFHLSIVMLYSQLSVEGSGAW